MNQACWTRHDDTGFLMRPDPIRDLAAEPGVLSAEIAEQLQALSANLATSLADKSLRPTVDALPLFDMQTVCDSADFRLIERCFQIYGGLANAYVWADEHDPVRVLPASVATPLVKLAETVERPPIIVYATTALSNFALLDPAGAYVAENMTTVQSFTLLDDEVWFNVVHADIEMRAGPALAGCVAAQAATQDGDVERLVGEFGRIATSFEAMLTTFRRMPHRCSPDVYYHTLRPFLFGFDGVVYDGVEKYGGKPQHVIGETGAQSSVIPAVQTFLGLQHARGGLSKHLEIMREHMPKPHREFLAQIDDEIIRDFVKQSGSAEARDGYNACLELITAFRSQHLHFANAYIASKVKNPTGTGGTDFMQWLKQLRDETEQQMLR